MHIFPHRSPLQELGGERFKLISYSATPEQWAEWLRVPLEHAAARGNLDLVNTLLQGGADGSAGWRGCRGRTLLHAAAVGGNPGVVTALLRAGAQPDVNLLSMSPKRSALYVATVCGHEEVVRLLIQAGADVNFKDAIERGSVLHEVCCGSDQLLDDLLAAGADPNSDFGPRGSTPLHQAASAGYCGNISALLLRGVNKDALDHLGATPLMWAASWGQVAAVETLLAAGADINIRSDENGTALDYAASRGRVPIIKAIMRHGADVNSRDTGGYLAIHKAAECNQADAVDALVEAGADVELKSSTGETPLFDATFSIASESMLALLERGGNARTPDTLGRTPLHIGCYRKLPGLEAVVDLLLRWGADESALDQDGRAPAGLLEVGPPPEIHPRCSQKEIERVRLLLARAPADRAWRRRGWLVMLRSRASVVVRGGHGHGGKSGRSGGGSNVTGDREGGSRKAARIEATADAGARDGMREKTGSGEVGGVLGIGAGGGAEADGVGLSDVVALLLGLELEGVFRTVVSFL